MVPASELQLPSIVGEFVPSPYAKAVPVSVKTMRGLKVATGSEVGREKKNMRGPALVAWIHSFQLTWSTWLNWTEANVPLYWFLLVATELSKNAQVPPRKFVALMVGEPFWTEVVTDADGGPEVGV